MEVIFEDRSLWGAFRGEMGTQRGARSLPPSAPINICAYGWRRMTMDVKDHLARTILEECQ